MPDSYEIEGIKHDAETLLNHKNGFMIVVVEKGHVSESHLAVADDPRDLRNTSTALFAVAQLAFYEMESKRKAREDYAKAAAEPIVDNKKLEAKE